MTQPAAKQIRAITTAFGGALSSADDEVQKALDTLDDAGPTVKTISGSADIDVSVANDGDIDITGFTNVKRIRRAWFWISANGADLGANTDQPGKLLFFSKDTFSHIIDDADPNTGGLVVELVEFHFVVQDLETAITAGASAINIDDTELYSAGLLVRVVDSAEHEFQRLETIDTSTDMTAVENLANSYALNDDVALVLEVPGFDYEDQDGTDELHMRFDPGDTAGDDVRLHWVIEFEDTKR